MSKDRDLCHLTTSTKGILDDVNFKTSCLFVNFIMSVKLIMTLAFLSESKF